MRAVLHGFHEPMHEPILARLVESLELDYCQLTHDRFQPQLPPSVRAVRHHWWDLNVGEYHTDLNRLRYRSTKSC